MASTTGTPPDKDGLHPYANLYKSDEHIGYVTCRLCENPVLEIKPHLTEKHPRCSFEMYVKTYPKEEYYAKRVVNAKEQRDVTEIEVTEDEAREHPAGYDGAWIEKHLDPNERRSFRRHVEALSMNEYPPRTVAKIAYHQILSGRLFKIIEKAQALSTGDVLPTEHIDAYTKMQQKVEALISAADQDKRVRSDATDPVTLLETTMADAEAYIRSHQGEFSCKCPKCGELYIPPGIPHWAFAALETMGGIQYPVWSKEMWDLVHEGSLELWQMAYALRTSPEGLLYTARRRGDEWPQDINLEEQERKLRARLVAADANFETARRSTETRGE